MPSCADGNILVCFARRLDPLGLPGVRCALYAPIAGGEQRCVCRALCCQSYFPDVEGTCWSPVPSFCQEKRSDFAHRLKGEVCNRNGCMCLSCFGLMCSRGGRSILHPSIRFRSKMLCWLFEDMPPFPNPRMLFSSSRFQEEGAMLCDL